MANVEGEAAKRMAGATAKGGRVSGIVGALFAEKWLNRSSGGKGGSKSGIDYHNEELARQYDFSREENRTKRTIETARTNKKEGLGIKGERSSTPSAGSYGLDLYGVSSPRPRRATNKSSGGQGTSGNARGKQTAGVGETPKTPAKPPAVSKPRAPRTPKATGSGEMLV